MRTVLASVLVLATAGAASAQSVLLAPVEGPGIDETLVAQVDAGLRSEARKVLADRFLAASPARPPGCTDDATCAARLAAGESADHVLLPTLRETDAGHELTARLFDASGRPLAEAVREGAGSLDVATLRSVAVQLFDSASYVGRLQLDDVPEGAQVFVDDIPLGAEQLTGPVALSVGEHRVDVRGPGLRRDPVVVELRFDADTALSLASPSPEPTAGAAPLPARGRPALWPGLVAAGVAGGAALSSAVFVGDYLWTRSLREGSLDERLASVTSSEKEAHLVAADLAAASAGLAKERTALRLDTFGMAASGAVLVVAGAAAAALLADWALAPSLDDSASTEEP